MEILFLNKFEKVTKINYNKFNYVNLLYFLIIIYISLSLTSCNFSLILKSNLTLTFPLAPKLANISP